MIVTQERKKVDFIHLANKDFLSRPKIFLREKIYSRLEADLMAEILYRTQLNGGRCRISNAELAYECATDLSSVRLLKKKMTSNPSFSPYIVVITKNNGIEETEYQFFREKYVEFEKSVSAAGRGKSTLPPEGNPPYPQREIHPTYI